MRNWKDEAIQYIAANQPVPDFIVRGLIDENQRLQGRLDHYKEKELVYVCNDIKASNNDIPPLYSASVSNSEQEK